MAVKKTNTQETAVAEKVTEMKKEKKTFDQSDGVKCRSVVQGSLYVEGTKTGMIYSFTDYGDESEIEYRDLAALVRSKHKSVYNPWFIVEDEDFIAEFPALQKYYDEQYTVRDLKSMLRLPVDEMESQIKTLPKTAVESLKSIASKMVADGELDSLKKIKALDRIFDTDLNLISELFAE